MAKKCSSISILRHTMTVLGLVFILGTLSKWYGDYRQHFPDPEELLRRLSAPAGFEVSVFAAEPMLVNPVALSVDEQNRIYVTETQSYNWEGDYPDEQLACRTFEQSEALRQRDLLCKPHPTNRSERVRLLEDRSGQGRADSAVTFCDGFELSTGVAAGVLARHGRVWLANAPDLWLLCDTKGQGHANSREVLLHGFGVRRANMGHDLHGLIFGPDGKLYFSMGDRGLNVRTREGNTIALPDTGSVLRCNPDGTDLEVFAVGLRNPQKLAFDQFGNLWTVDNNANKGDPSRCVYVVEGGDSGWRIGYEILPDCGPWLQERLWDPAAPAAYRVPPVGWLGQGPAGLAYYPGTGLPSQYEDHFFLCNFPENVLSFSVRPRGAGFELKDVQPFLSTLWPTDIGFGTDGTVYVSDWGPSWSMTQRGRIFRVAHHESRHVSLVAETKKLLADGMDQRTVEELVDLLGHRDQRVRQTAQFALAERGQAAEAPLVSALAPSRPRLARIHAI
jgi:quinoprotein glucose dehydrogenase